jgi:hypothetical protein
LHRNAIDNTANGDNAITRKQRRDDNDNNRHPSTRACRCDKTISTITTGDYARFYLRKSIFALTDTERYRCTRAVRKFALSRLKRYGIIRPTLCASANLLHISVIDPIKPAKIPAATRTSSMAE